MSIPQRSFYHGAVLAEITENDNFTSINRVPNIKSTSAYQVNHNMGIFIKYTTTGDLSKWRFTFTPSQQDIIRKMFNIYEDRTYIVFVCQNEGICIVDYGIFAACVDMNHRDNEWCEIYRNEGGSFRIRGANGEYEKTIPLNAFPRILFE